MLLNFILPMRVSCQNFTIVSVHGNEKDSKPFSHSDWHNAGMRQTQRNLAIYPIHSSVPHYVMKSNNKTALIQISLVIVSMSRSYKTYNSTMLHRKQQKHSSNSYYKHHYWHYWNPTGFSTFCQICIHGKGGDPQMVSLTESCVRVGRLECHTSDVTMTSWYTVNHLMPIVAI